MSVPAHAAGGANRGEPADHASHFWLATALAAAAWVASILGLVASSPRLLAAFHGFLHSGVATRFPSPTLVPENPYFAGEPLRYYWFYHWVGSLVSRGLGLDQIHAFQFIALASLTLLVVTGALIGRHLYRSTAAGLMVGYLALVGMNPLGPVIAVAKALLTGAPLWEHSLAAPAGNVFVSNPQADALLARPLLGAMHVGTDWQSSQDLVWFFDVSSRGPSIALLMLLAWLMVGPRSWWTLPGVALTGALTAALNPIVGFSAAGTLVAAAVLVRVAGSRWPRLTGPAGHDLLDSVVFTVGVALAWPLYSNIFAVHDTVLLTLDRWFVIKTANIVAGFLVLLPLAVWGVLKAPGGDGPRASVATLTLASLFLIGVVPFVGLYEINQHNFVNAASCLLAVPAAAWVVQGRSASTAVVLRRSLWLAAAFVPMTVGLFLAFGGRGEIPLRASGGELRRLPADGPVALFYDWVATTTTPDAVLVVDPDEPVKMSGNVTEIPAMTRRAVFTDHVTYMNESYEDLDMRRDLARRAVGGQPLTGADRDYFAALHRPVYVVSFHADRAAERERLVASFGEPAFAHGFVAAFQLATPK